MNLSILGFRFNVAKMIFRDSISNVIMYRLSVKDLFYSSLFLLTTEIDQSLFDHVQQLFFFILMKNDQKIL